MSTTTQPHRQVETPRSIALSRHRSPSRWLTDAVSHPLRRAGLPGLWPWVAAAGAALAALLVL